MQFIEIILIK